jgi:integrase
MPVLTAAAVRKYAPQNKRREIRDAQAPGLYLVIQPRPSGTKSWAMRFRRPDGRHGKLTLGRVDLDAAETSEEPAIGAPLTLRQARQLANKIDRERARGQDVIEQHNASRLRQRSAAASSFLPSLVDFFREHKTKWSQRPREWRAWAHLLGLDWPAGCDPAEVEPQVLPGSIADAWRDRPVTDIDGHDVHALVADVRRRGFPGLERCNATASDARARKLHALLSSFFGWLCRQRRVEVNPCKGVFPPAAPPSRERVLEDDEIKSLWAACDAIPGAYARAVKLMLLTGARKNEVCRMRREEVDADGVWTLPADRAKNHRAHVLPLPPAALELIGDGFDAPTGWSNAKRLLDAAMRPAQPWVIHDLRRTCASGMQKLRIRGEVIERALNHVSGSFRGVAGIYQRDPLTEEVRDALERWAAHVEGIVEGRTANVVALRSASR